MTLSFTGSAVLKDLPNAGSTSQCWARGWDSLGSLLQATLVTTGGHKLCVVHPSCCVDRMCYSSPVPAWSFPPALLLCDLGPFLGYPSCNGGVREAHVIPGSGPGREWHGCPALCCQQGACARQPELSQHIWCCSQAAPECDYASRQGASSNLCPYSPYNRGTVMVPLCK